MAKSPRNAIRFGCPRCQTRLFARPSQAGTKRRCPRCQFVFPVPTAEEAMARAGKRGPDAEYGVSERPGPTGNEASQKYLSIVCPVCKTRMHATEDQVGQQLSCPDCETVVVVPPPPEPASQETPHHAIDPSEEYPLWGIGQPPREIKEVYQTYIPVVCAVCRTRMLATEEQVGQQLVCPDCGTAVIVRPVAKPPAVEDAAATPDGEEATYALCASPGQPAAGSVAYQPHIPVVCPVCHTRLHATLDQVGTELICPDCLAAITVPPPQEALPKIDPMEGADEGYTIGTPVRPPEFQPIFEYSWTKELEEPPPRKQRPPAAGAQATPSGQALVTGTVGFLLEPGVLIRWSALSLLALLVFCLAVTAISLGSVASIGSYIFSMLVCIPTFLFGALWFAAASALLIAVVVDTAAGNDRVENWPEGFWGDWIGDAFYVFNALAVSVPLGIGLAWLLRGLGLPSAVWIGGSVFLLLPVVLLSMLEGGTALKPLSGPILRSLRTAFWAWGLVYLEMAVLLLVAGGLVGSLYWALGNLGIALGLPILTAALFVYFRLLGRLAWVCAQESEDTAEDAAEEDSRGK